jgi:hypothetical protein
VARVIPVEVVPPPTGGEEADLRGTLDPTPWLFALLLALLAAEGILSLGIRRRSSAAGPEPDAA